MASLLNQQAPNFELWNTEGEKVKLNELNEGSSVILLFFPLAFTSVCTAELCSMRDNLKRYEALNAKVYGISVDSFFTLREFKKQQNLNFELLSDFNSEAAKSYQAFYEDFMGLRGVAKRSAFVINPEGEVIYEEVLEDASKIPNFEAIASSLS